MATATPPRIPTVSPSSNVTSFLGLVGRSNEGGRLHDVDAGDAGLFEGLLNPRLLHLLGMGAILQFDDGDVPLQVANLAPRVG